MMGCVDGKLRQARVTRRVEDNPSGDPYISGRAADDGVAWMACSGKSGSAFGLRTTLRATPTLVDGRHLGVMPGSYVPATIRTGTPRLRMYSLMSPTVYCP